MDNKISKYSLLAGSVSLVGGLTQHVDATISHTDINMGVGYNSPSNGYIHFDFDGGAYSTAYNTSMDFGISVTTFVGFRGDQFTRSGSAVDVLISGETVNSGLSFAVFESTTSTVTSSGNDYIGVSLSRSGNTHYGWARISKNGNVMTLHEFAWNQTAGESINAGQTVVPEPAESVLMMAAGAAGLAALRKRRQDKKSA